MAESYRKWPLESPEPFEEFGLDSDKLALYACISYAGTFGAAMLPVGPFVRDVLLAYDTGIPFSEAEVERVVGYLTGALDVLEDMGAVDFVNAVPRLHPDIERRLDLEILCRGRIQLYVSDLLNPDIVRRALMR